MERITIINKNNVSDAIIASLPIAEKVRAVIVTPEGMLVMTCEMSEGNRYRHGIAGGTLEPGESLREGLEREIKEETGFSIEILDELGYVDVVRKEYISRSMFWLVRTVGEQAASMLTDDERAVGLQCVIVPYERGVEIVEKEFMETGNDISERSLIALKIAKEILEVKK